MMLLRTWGGFVRSCSSDMVLVLFLTESAGPYERLSLS